MQTVMPRARLFGLSFLMLFTELALIRWTGANIVYLSYFSNFVLLGSFLGIGLGFLRAKSRVDLFRWAPVALALLILFVLVFPVQVSRGGGQLLFFTSPIIWMPEQLHSGQLVMQLNPVNYLQIGRASCRERVC